MFATLPSTSWRVLIIFAVAQAFHQSGGRVAQVQRDGFSRSLFDVVLHVAVRGIERIRFRRDREIDDGLRESEISFRHADEVHGIACGHAERKRIRIGQANVFHRHAHDAARNVERIFTGFDHAAQPVECGVRIAIAHGLVQGGNQVVVFFAGFVVEQGALLQRIADDVVGDLCRLLSGLLRESSGDLQHVIGAARVAAGVAGDYLEHIVGCAQLSWCPGRALRPLAPASAVAQSDLPSAAATHRRGSARATRR